MRAAYGVFSGILLAALLLSGCATSSLGTARFRDQAMEAGAISLSTAGLSKEQVEVILGTRFPPEKPVSVSLFYLVGNDYSSVKYDPTPAIIKKLSDTKHIQRIVPVPHILLPEALTFDAIQQVGIRALCEYSIVFYGSYRNALFSYKSPLGHYMISSTLDFLLIDNRTTAIIASDKIFSEFQTPIEFFSDKNRQKNLEKMYEEQANAFYEKIINLFGGRKP